MTQATSHLACTETIATRGGQECVGAWVRVAGPDWVLVFVAASLGVGEFYASMQKD